MADLTEARGVDTSRAGADPPRRADDITLIGEMKGSGYREPPALARRADGQTIQLTPLLYAVLEAVDGQRDLPQVASAVAERTGRPVNADNAAQLVDKLRELGLVVQADGTQPELQRSNPLLGLRMKVAVTDPDRTRRLIAPFMWLFSPLAMVPLIAAFAWIAWWILFHEGLAAAAHDAFAKPGLLLAVIAVTVLSAGFHEFGHAAAAQKGGATPGVMGAGFYLIWPAFYTDVTDSYRLGRAGRIRTDLGGLYFNAIVTVLSVVCWWLSGYDAILLIVATQILQMLRQLLPLVRFDGYHVLADVTGVPDLFHRIGPTLRSLVPWTESDPRASALKPWARAVVTLWVLVVIPVFASTMVMLALTLPRIVGSALASANSQRHAMLAAFHDGDLVATTARAAAGVIVLLPIFATGYVLVRLSRRTTTSVWRRTQGKPVQRALSGVLALALVAGLAWLWWPSETRYRPIMAWEGGTVSDVVSPVVGQAGIQVGTQGTGTVMYPDGATLPSRDHPQLATVLIPTGTAPDTETGGTTSAPGTSTPTTTTTTPTTTTPNGPWIFPFDQPPAPEEGDNQAVAANTTDNTVDYAVAFAMVWEDGSQPADNTNSAYAVADCTNCAAVAVAFQVVFVVGQTDIAVPQNVSVAVNYDCTSCLTYSLAVQLFVTLDGPLSDEAMAQIDTLWQQIMAYGATIDSVPLSEIQGQLSAYEEQILAIVQADQGTLTPTTSPSSTLSPTDGASASPTGLDPTSSESPAVSGSASPTSDPTGSSSTTGPSDSPSQSPTPSTSDTPSATSTPSASVASPSSS